MPSDWNNMHDEMKLRRKLFCLIIQQVLSNEIRLR